LSSRYLDLIIVALAAGSVGALEVAERFRDEPLKAVFTLPAAAYIAINAAAGILALLLLRLLDVKFGVSEDPEFTRWARVVAAGFSAVVVLRSTVFVTREGNEERSYGLANFILRALHQAENAIARVRGPKRADAVEEVIAGLTYAEARTALGALASSQLPTATEAARAELAETQKTIEAVDETDEVKLRLLCMAILNFGGEKVLGRAAAQLLAIKTASSS
jgi:hypothetical protein